MHTHTHRFKRRQFEKGWNAHCTHASPWPPIYSGWTFSTACSGMSLVAWLVGLVHLQSALHTFPNSFSLFLLGCNWKLEVKRSSIAFGQTRFWVSTHWRTVTTNDKTALLQMRSPDTDGRQLSSKMQFSLWQVVKQVASLKMGCKTSTKKHGWSVAVGALVRTKLNYPNPES